MLPNRRHFLARSLWLLLGSDEPESAVTFFDADFLIECRGLHCAVERQDDSTWLLVFSIFRTTKTWCGEKTERMIPSPTLQKKLVEIGIATKYDGPFLVARSEQPVDAGQLLHKMRLL